MKISVIIPTYQRSAMLMDALASLREQTFSKNDFEIIIVDNALKKTNDLLNLCSEEKGLNLEYVHEPKCGLHYARHAGAKNAHTDLLAYIDDDVICPPEWLQNMYIAFEDKDVAMIAGKTLLKFEGTPEPAFEAFRSMYSEFDLGKTPFSLPPYKSAVGANMGVRKNYLFDVGGFNPDGYGDRKYIKYRGDGEAGLARKFHDAGLKVMYSAETCLWHRVSAERQTAAYLIKRSQNGAIEFIYGEFRYKNSCRGIIRNIINSTIRASIHKILQIIPNKVKHLQHVTAYSYHRSVVCQALALLCSKDIRINAKKGTYL